MVGEFKIQSLESIKKKARKKALSFLQLNENRLPFENKFNVYNLEYIEIMTEMNHLNNKNTCFQVASQTNCLEHINNNNRYGPEVGITDYIKDKTQGPACAIAAAPGTYYRNYLCMDCEKPQNKDKQLNTLEFLDHEIQNENKYFSIKNGYIEMNDEQKKTNLKNY